MSATAPLPVQYDDPRRLLRDAIAAADRARDAAEHARGASEQTRDTVISAASLIPPDSPAAARTAALLADLAAAEQLNLCALVTGYHHVAELRDAVDRMSIALVVGADLASAADTEPGPEPARRRARSRHARPRTAARHLHAAKSPLAVLPLAGLAAKGWTARRALKLAAAAAAVPVAVAGTGAVNAPYITPAPPQHVTAAARPAPPAPAVSPSPRLATSHAARRPYEGRHRAPAPAPPPPPAPQPSPSPSSSGPARGILAVQQAQLALGSARSAQLVINAQGGLVLWQASSSTPDVQLSVSHGGLAAGQSAVIQVTVDPAAAVLPGQAVITINGQQVTVTWGR